MQMTSHEAFVETLRVQGVTVTFGIVGSAFMPGLDVFERAGIRFVDVAHEQGAAHMADGLHAGERRDRRLYRPERPGITNFVTAVAAGLLEPHPHGGRHTGDRLQHPGAGWIPGNPPAAVLRGDHLPPGDPGAARRGWSETLTPLLSAGPPAFGACAVQRAP